MYFMYFKFFWGLFHSKFNFLRFEDLVSQSSILLQSNEKMVYSLVTILSDVYLQLISDPKQPWKVHDVGLAECLIKLLTVLFQTGTPSNVKIATQKLKVNRFLDA